MLPFKLELHERFAALVTVFALGLLISFISVSFIIVQFLGLIRISRCWQFHEISLGEVKFLYYGGVSGHGARFSLINLPLLGIQSAKLFLSLQNLLIIPISRRPIRFP